MTSRRKFLGGLVAAWLAGTATAQPRLRRIAVVSLVPIEEHPVASLVEGLRELGYQHGRDIEILSSRGHLEHGQLQKMAADAVESDAQVIVTYGATATAAVKSATTKIPIVMVTGSDPVRMGFVGNLARPEGNITGLGTSTQVLISKRVELLKEIVPGMRRLATLWNSSSKGQTASLKILEQAATRVAVTVVAVDLRGREGLAGVREILAREKPDALTPLPATSLVGLGPAVLKLAAERRLPAVYADAAMVRAGGLAAYSADIGAQLRRAAYYVDRILKGARPGELPVEQPTKFELAINLRTAKALGLAIPGALMIRADEVVE